jgi:Phosphotransferase enzyme family
MDLKHIEAIIKEFAIVGKLHEARPYGNGHLHDTFLVSMQPEANEDNKPEQYILQRINHSAFHNPPALMENIIRITNHIRLKLRDKFPSQQELSRRVLHVIFSREGNGFYLDHIGNYWRVYSFVSGTRSYDTIKDPAQLFQVSYMFGQFLHLLADLPSPPLHEGIADFHHGPKRLAAFRTALTTDTCNRAREAATEIQFLERHAAIFDKIPALVKQGDIPLRPTHNDTKVNNVLLDNVSGEGVCVIDLDTAMTGVSLYDFGDLVRTTLSNKDEDETDLSGVFADIPRFEVILKGFLAGCGPSLNQMEVDNLILGSKFMTLLIGMRFLTDFLQGDPYFKIHRENQNLDRCRRQFKLVQSILEHEEEMQAIVVKVSQQ